VSAKDPAALLRSYDPRPRSTTELLDAAFAVLRSDLRAVALFSVAPHVAVTAVVVLLPRTIDPWVLLLRSALTWCLLAVPSYALQTIWAQRLLGSQPSLGSAAGEALRRAPSVMLATLASCALVLVGAVLLLGPGLYAMMAFLIAAPVLVFERGGPWRSLARSRTLMKTRKRRLALPVAALIVVLTGAAFVPLGSYGMWLRVAMSGVIMGVFSALAFVTYVDARAHKEGFDLEILAARVAARTATVEAPAASDRQAPALGDAP
jgi:hypothetical protein